MAQVVYSRGAFSGLERIIAFLSAIDRRLAAEALGLIGEAISVLRRHPLIGREVEDGLRELVISRGKSGYVALYSFEATSDTVLVLAIRHQREAGYFPDHLAHTDESAPPRPDRARRTPVPSGLDGSCRRLRR